MKNEMGYPLINAEKSNILLLSQWTHGAVCYFSARQEPQVFFWLKTDSLAFWTALLPQNIKLPQNGIFACALAPKEPYFEYFFQPFCRIASQEDEASFINYFQDIAMFLSAPQKAVFGLYCRALSILTIDLRKILCNGIHMDVLSRMSVAGLKVTNRKTSEQKFVTGGI